MRVNKVFLFFSSFLLSLSLSLSLPSDDGQGEATNHGCGGRWGPDRHHSRKPPVHHEKASQIQKKQMHDDSIVPLVFVVMMTWWGVKQDAGAGTKRGSSFLSNFFCQAPPSVKRNNSAPPYTQTMLHNVHLCCFMIIGSKLCLNWNLKDNSGAQWDHMIMTHVHRVRPFSGISFHSSPMEPNFSKTAN